MARVRWQQVRDALREHCSAPDPPPSARFWEEFREAISRDPGQEAGSDSVPFPSVRPWRFAWASAALIVIALGVFVLSGRDRAGTVQERGRAFSVVEEVDVFVPYDSMVIMQDRELGGSIVWVGDLDASDAVGSQ